VGKLLCSNCLFASRATEQVKHGAKPKTTKIYRPIYVNGLKPGVITKVGKL